MAVSQDDRTVPGEGFRALLSLHAHAGGVEASRIPGFTPLPVPEALRVVAEAPDISRAARLEALHDLAKAGFPGWEDAGEEYHHLASSVVVEREVDADQLLDDLKETSVIRGGFQAAPSRQAFAHHEAAFIGQDVCTIRRVTVGGREAVWIFSEFETDAPFDQVAYWLDPQNWSRWGQPFFREMDIVGPGGKADVRPPVGDPHWHALFKEVVQFPWQQLDTLLHCDYWQDNELAAGMTYDLARSIDSEIDVDRGFILANVADPGLPAAGAPAGTAPRPILRVKVLKIVGFTQDVWDYAAEWVCPFWTDWIRGAVEGATMSRPATPTHAPEGAGHFGEYTDAWMSFLGTSARPYLDLLGDVSKRLGSGGYDLTACLDDERRYWSMLAKDWAAAWKHGLNTVDEVARKGFGASFGPPGSFGSSAAGGDGSAATTATGTTGAKDPEGMLTAVAGLGPNDHPTCSDLVSIEQGGPTIASSNIVVSVDTLTQDSYAVRLQSTDTTAPPALYVGHLTVATGQPPVPVQLYISRALRR